LSVWPAGADRENQTMLPWQLHGTASNTCLGQGCDVFMNGCARVAMKVYQQVTGNSQKATIQTHKRNQLTIGFEQSLGLQRGRTTIARKRFLSSQGWPRRTE